MLVGFLNSQKVFIVALFTLFTFFRILKCQLLTLLYSFCKYVHVHVVDGFILKMIEAIGMVFLKLRSMNIGLNHELEC